MHIAIMHCAKKNQLPERNLALKVWKMPISEIVFVLLINL